MRRFELNSNKPLVRAQAFWNLGREVTNSACVHIELKGKLKPSEKNVLDFFLYRGKEMYDRACEEHKNNDSSQ